MERKHHHIIMNVTRSLLFQSNLPKIFWSLATLHVVFLINRIPSKHLHNLSPNELLHNREPDFNFLKVFGYLAFASTLSTYRTKLDPRSRKCIFVGFKQGTKGYLLYDLQTREIFLRQNVIFYEQHFPYHHIPSPSTTTNPTPLPFPFPPSYIDDLYPAVNSPLRPATTLQRTHPQNTSPSIPDT